MNFNVNFNILLSKYVVHPLVKIKKTLIGRHIQGESGGICNTSGNDSMCNSKQESSYEYGPILNSYRDMVKRRYGPSCEHEQKLRNK